MNANKNFGINVNALRKHCKISRETLAALAGMSLCTISHIEQGRANTTIEYASSIADALGIDLPLLLMDNINRKVILGVRNKTLNINRLEPGEVAFIMKSKNGLHVFSAGTAISNQIALMAQLSLNNAGRKELHQAIENSPEFYNYAINNL